ncbi:MAG: zinc-dependent dehydrogenase [Candidatus Geothermarchaeales archaeon]
MKAAFLVEGGGIEVREVPIPEIGPREVLVRMKACGICGTDIEKSGGKFLTPPVLGHEVTGEVAKRGTEVEGLQVGDRVIVHHHVPCHRCHHCKRGSHTMCEDFPRTNLDPGGFAEYFRVPEALVAKGAVFPLPDEVSFEAGTLVEPTGCCLRALEECQVQLGEDVAVLGAGPAGLLHVQLLRSMGSRRVLTTDVADFRLEAAERAGATAVFNPKLEDVEERMQEHTEGRGVDLAIVATGNPQAIRQALGIVRKGGRILLFGTPHKGAELPVDFSQLFIRETKIIPSYSTTEAEMEKALMLIRKGILDVTSLITHRFKLDAFPEALDQAKRAGESLKVVVQP